MKIKKSKTKKILAGLAAFAIIGGLLVIANGLVGNPISKMIVNKKAKEYVNKNYNDLDLRLEDAVYNFKDGRYFVRARSDKSIDTHFEINFTGTGKVHYDNYKDNVLSKWNTWQRINSEYRKLVDIVVDDFPDTIDIAYGQLLDKNNNFSHLELDKKYDIKEIGRNQGHLVLYFETQYQDKETMIDGLKYAKEIFDDYNLPFYSVDITLQKPKDEKQNYEEGLMVKDFLYDDIYKEGLERRVEKNIKETKKYYEEEDNKMKEIEEYKKENEE